MPTIPIIAAAEQLSRERPIWLVDIWGVLHNGVAPYPSTVEALSKHRAAGGRVVLITNAPRPADAVDVQLRTLGVPQTAYDAIVTSGDVTSSLLAANGAKRTLHIGPERDTGLFKGHALTRLPPDAPATLAEAELIVCTGLFDDTRETPETYRRMLEICAQRRVPMICANPDLKVERGGVIVPCAGAVAQYYEHLGGPVDYAGKPYAPIYNLARDRVAAIQGRQPAPSEILCIGDGLRTDIKGAHDQALAVLYVASDVDMPDGFSAAAVAKLFETTPYRPIGAQRVLTW